MDIFILESFKKEKEKEKERKVKEL